MKYYKKLISILPVALGLIFCAEALGQSRWQGTCDIVFAGTSTLHGWSGKVATEPFSVSITDAGDLSKTKITADVRVLASKMDTGNAKRDAKMRDCIEVTSYPEITVALPAVLTAAATKPVVENGVPHPTVIPFTMSLKGKVQQFTGKVTNWKFDGAVATFTVAFPVSLKASGIKVPSVLGLIRVGDKIEVTAAMKLVAPGASATK